MSAAVAVRVTSFGDGRFDYQAPSGAATVEEALQSLGLEAKGRRVAVNGRSAGLGTGLVENDEVTIVPRIHGG